MHYLELPYKKCKSCRRFDPSCSRDYSCEDESICPALEVQLVIRDSVADLVNRYKTAANKFDIETQREILEEVTSRGNGFIYKFKQNLQKKERS